MANEQRSGADRRAKIDDDGLLRSFESLTLSPDSIGHEDHVRLAWIALRTYPLAEAIDRQTEGLRRFVEHHGATGKYHATITWAHLLLVHERIAKQPEVATWAEFAERNPDLLDRSSGGILSRYYTHETLDSDVARSTFLFPDLVPDS